MWLKIEASVNSKLKVTWGNGGGNYPDSYDIGAKNLRDEADNLRARLTELADCYESDDARLRRHLLVELAKAGVRLRSALFATDLARCKIKDLQQWIVEENAGGDCQLTIQADSSIHVPWGLIYDGAAPPLSPAAAPPAAPPGQAAADSDTATAHDDVRAAEIEEFSGFWCLKYSLSAHAHAGYAGARSRMSRPQATFGRLSLVNSDILEKMQRELSPNEYLQFQKWLQPPIGKAQCLSECQDLIGKTDCKDILLYFLGHHRNATLDLGDKSKIDYLEFNQLIDALVDHSVNSCGLLFLNGCDTAIGDQDVSLRGVANRPELCGVIATESKIPTLYAAKFGWRFMDLLATGNTVAMALAQLRRDCAFWPESLVYGCYAHPDYCIRGS